MFIQRRVLKKRPGLDLALLLLIVGLSTINRYFVGYDKLSGLDYVPDFFLVLAVFFLAKSLTIQGLKILAFLIAFEILVGIFEYATGIKSVFGYGEEYLGRAESIDYFYYRNVFGLSMNSSVLAQKAFFLLLLSFFLSPYLKRSLTAIFIALSAAGIFITFNRSAIFAATVFIGLSFIRMVKEKQASVFQKIVLAMISVAVIGIGLFYSETLVGQIFRGREFNLAAGEVDLSGRWGIWLNYVDFISQNPLWGNNSIKYFSEYSGRVAHGHNSFLQYFATNGLVIFLLMQFFVIRNIRFDNFNYVLAILVYSLAQYLVYWSFSLPDVLFFFFLTAHRQVNSNNACSDSKTLAQTFLVAVTRGKL